MSKNEGVENELDLISEELTKLGKSTKLKDILKKHKTIKTNLNVTSEKLASLKTTFESAIVANNVDQQKEIIDDETYDKYSKEITEILETNFDELDLETQVKKYKVLAKKIQCCETFLKSKKMELIDCDKTEAIVEIRSDAESEELSENS